MVSFRTSFQGHLSRQLSISIGSGSLQPSSGHCPAIDAAVIVIEMIKMNKGSIRFLSLCMMILQGFDFSIDKAIRAFLCRRFRVLVPLHAETRRVS